MKIASSLKLLACAASALAMSSAANAAVYLFSVTGNGQTYEWYMDLDPTVYEGNMNPNLETFDPHAGLGFYVTNVQGSFTGFSSLAANVFFWLEDQGDDAGVSIIDPYGSGLDLYFGGPVLFSGSESAPSFLPTDGSLGSTLQPVTLFDDAGISYTFSIEDCGCDPLAAVPEPATWGMMIAGFGIMGAALRSRRQRISFGSKAAA